MKMHFTIKIRQSRTLSLSILIIFVLINLLQTTECLYEDQIGKFDWTKRYVGILQHGILDERSNQVYISTTENVLASLNADTGTIIWRQILERGDRGTINFLNLVSDLSDADEYGVERANRRPEDSTLLTVTGTNALYLVRGWNARSGNLAWEWTTTLSTPKADIYWYKELNTLYAVAITWGIQIETTYYQYKTGQQLLKGQQISISGVSKESCVISLPYVICADQHSAISIDVTSGLSHELVSNPQSQTLQVVQGKDPLVRVGDTIYNLISQAPVDTKSTSSIAYFYQSKYIKDILFEAQIENSSINTKLSYVKGEVIGSFDTEYPTHFDEASIIDVTCKRSKRNEPVCRALFSTKNGALAILQSGKWKWTREDSLANIVAINIVDLPLANSEGTIEEQLKNKNGDILSGFAHRLTGHLTQLGHLFHTLFDIVSTGSVHKDDEITRDDFGLHAMIVVVTTTGKLFGIDNISGKFHYVTYLPNFTGFNNEKIQLVVQRTSKHYPHRAQCLVIAKHKTTGNGVIYQFDPITGTKVNDGITELNYQIKQISVLQPGEDFLKGVLLLDHNNQLHVIPESASELAKGTYIYSANKDTSVVTGYYVEQNNKALQAVKTWSINLGGNDNSQKIYSIASKNPIEHVHSQGRVLNDRSVLYKYINPNLVAIVTQGPDNIYKYIFNIHLVDVVSGGIVTTIVHRRSRGPINIVHSENWLVYSYYNDKVRRTEITAIELYEGSTQANSTVWSSLDAPPLPVITQQSYILPATVLTLQETITEKGITNKHILMALSTGGIMEMPWHLLDPRRPVLGVNQPREEGTIPYMPELPVTSESIINYNQTLARIDGIYTAPSGLESTCLVVAYGLDFYVTRIAPSKTYDLLKDDFDYFLITSVLIGLIAASFIVKHMSAKKALKQAWK